ncbi:MAG: hypothetical protein LUF28_06850 [Clostridiales bacterium]|nr:hypothetical protein [Clostridiales bacterium]
MSGKFLRAAAPALLLAAVLWGCGSGEGAVSSGGDSSGVSPAESSYSVSPEDTEDTGDTGDGSEADASAEADSAEQAEAVVEDAPVSSDLIPENLTEQYAALLSGLWVDDSGDSYYINADGSGSLYRTGAEEPDNFTWSVLAEQEEEALLYLFFTGAEAAERYLPVFDEGSLTLCDPDTGEAVILLTVGETFG